MGALGGAIPCVSPARYAVDIPRVSSPFSATRLQRPSWPKPYLRQALALCGLERYEEAVLTLDAGVLLCTADGAVDQRTELEAMEEAREAAMQAGEMMINGGVTGRAVHSETTCASVYKFEYQYEAPSCAAKRRRVWLVRHITLL